MMGNYLQKQKNMADNYRDMHSNLCLRIHFYGPGSEPLYIKEEELPLSCEDVCIQCAKHLSIHLGQFFHRENEKTIGPLLLPMFGLYAADHRLQQWMPDNFMLDQTSGVLEFYFRIRVRPNWKSIPGGIFVDYLFWQCSDDFLSGRLWTHFDMENKIRDINIVNNNVRCILVASAQYKLLQEVRLQKDKILHTALSKVTRLEYIREKVTLMNVHTHLPKKMSPELEKEYNLKDPLMRILARKHLHLYIKDFFETWQDQHIYDIRVKFVEHFLKSYVPYYGLEYFAADKVEDFGMHPLQVELIIRAQQERCVPGLYFNKKLKVHLKDLYGAEKADNIPTSQKCRFLLKLGLQPPMILEMVNSKSVDSFLSLLECYYRLKVNYYDSLNLDELASPTLRLLQDLHSFGPMEESDARNHLRKLKLGNSTWAQCEDFYMIYQDTLEFGLLHILGITVDLGDFVSYNMLYTLSATGWSIRLADALGGQSFTDASDLKCHLNQTLGRCISPQEEDTCGAMHFLKEDSGATVYSYAGSYVDRPQKKKASAMDDQPMFFREDQVSFDTAKRIAQGEFCDVFRIVQKEYCREAVLKQVTSKLPEVQEAHRKGADRLMRLGENNAFFVRVYGFIVTSPLRIIFESMPEGKGSLLHRLREPDTPPLNWLQVGSVLKQLAECLNFLKNKNMYYGCLCCAKILIRLEKEKALTIRLGDPSISLFYDTLDLLDSHNQRRLPWTAPERFSNLSKPSIETDIYSFGTVIWELMWRGKDPIERMPPNVNVGQFFKMGRMLPDPVFTKVTVAHGDVNHELSASGNLNSKHMHTQQWVNNQDFNSSHSEEDVGSYSKAAAPESLPESTLSSEDTTGNQTLLREIQKFMVDLMHKCWRQNPFERPKPLELLKAADNVESKAHDATVNDDLWHINLCLRIAEETHNFQDKQAARQLQQKISELQSKQAEGEARDKKELCELLQQLNQTVEYFIDSSLLDCSSNEKLGEGNFGKVVKGVLYEAGETRSQEKLARTGGVAVAVKKMKGMKQSDGQAIEFLKEALKMCTMNHQNVVKFMGLVIAGDGIPYQLVMELSDRGTLEKYVLKHAQKLGIKDFRKVLKNIAIDIAKGMEYICKTQGMVHGDLAARNVLLFRGGETITAKLSDFGLAHKLSKGQRGIFYYSLAAGVQIPIFWMPKEIIEEIDGGNELKLTAKTDVWSFGIVLWEMFSAKAPEAELNKKRLKDNNELIKDIKNYYQRQLLPKPTNCPAKVYEIMLRCWHSVPEDRSEFSTLIITIDELTDAELDD